MFEDYEDRVEERMEQIRPFLVDLSGLQRILCEDILNDICRINVQKEDVEMEVIKTGSTIVNNKGNVVRNPDIMTLHQLINEKNALIPKALKYVPESESKDALAAFVAR